MAYRDLRDWLEIVNKQGELSTIQGASCDLEMSSIGEIIYREGKNPKPVLMFDEIPGYPKGFRTLMGLLASTWRMCKTLGLPEDETEPVKMVKNWREKNRRVKFIPPKLVKEAPVLKNSAIEDDVDLFKFPWPRFHELDGGHYLTGHAVIQKEPDTGWHNIGTYRIMVVDRNRLALHILEGQQGSIIMHEKYFARNKSMPVAIAIGVDPALWIASANNLTPWGISEYDYAGGIKGEPLEVMEGEHTGILIPSRAEIVIEGDCYPGELALEGPFGEWHGYYGNLGLIPVPEQVIRVKAIHYRDKPILTCANPGVPPTDTSLTVAATVSAAMWSFLEDHGMPGIKGVWCHELGYGNLFNVISIEQLYAGHSRQVGLIASQYINYVGRYTVVVEDDIDPSNLEQVMWAITTRGLPDQSIQILPRCRSSSADPAIPLEEKKKYQVAPKPLTSARVLIDACRPLEWRKDWYPIAKISSDLRKKIEEKWQGTLSKYI